MKQKSKEKSISLIDFVFYFMMGNDMLTLSKYFSYLFGKKLGFLPKFVITFCDNSYHSALDVPFTKTISISFQRTKVSVKPLTGRNMCDQRQASIIT